MEISMFELIDKLKEVLKDINQDEIVDVDCMLSEIPTLKDLLLKKEISKMDYAKYLVNILLNRD